MTEMVERLRDVVIEEIEKQDGFLMDNRPLVRAVLEVLREPTEEMVDAGISASEDYFVPDDITVKGIKAAFRGMLSAAIGGN